MKVLLLTIDAWRATHAPPHERLPPGPQREVAAELDLTPNLSELAENGITFTRALAHGPSTPYAFPAVFGSTLPLAHGGYDRLHPERVLVTECLQTAGWQCHGIHANPWLKGKYGYDRGYDTYTDVGEFGLPLLERGREVLLDRFAQDDTPYRVAQGVYRKLRGPLRRLSGQADEVATAIEHITATGRGEDAFVWAHLLTPHAPYEPPERHQRRVGIDPPIEDPEPLVTRAQRDPTALEPAEREQVRRLYAAAVSHADEQVGPLLEAVGEDTLVIVTADHGEALFEHGQLGHEPALYEELLRVPLLVRPPGGTESRTSDALVQHVDIAPTVLDYAGVSAPESYRGHSLRPLVESSGDHTPVADATDADNSRFVIGEVASTADTPGQVDPSALQVCVRSSRRKLYYDAGEVVGYELSSDPGETEPITDISDSGWDRLETVLSRRVNRVERTSRGERGTFDSGTEQRLRDLGYLD